MELRTRFLLSIRPLIIFSKFFGVFPLRFNVNNSYSFSKFSIIVVFLIHVSATTFHIYRISIKNRLGFFDYSYAYLTLAFFFQVLHYFSCLSYLLRPKSLLKIFEDIIFLIESVHAKSFFKNHFKFLLIQNIVFTFLLFGFYASDFFFTEFNFLSFVYFIMKFYTGAGALLVHLQFVNIVLLTSKILEEINHRLELANNFDDLVDFGGKYSKVCDFCELINKCFAFPIVSCCVRCFGTILISANRMVYMDYSFEYAIPLISTLIFRFAELYYMLFVCEMIYSEVLFKA